MSDEKKVEVIAEQVRQQVGDIYMLVNNAGVVPCLPFKQLTYSQIRRTFDVNIMSHFWVIFSKVLTQVLKYYFQFADN